MIVVGYDSNSKDILFLICSAVGLCSIFRREQPPPNPTLAKRVFFFLKRGITAICYLCPVIQPRQRPCADHSSNPIGIWHLSMYLSPHVDIAHLNALPAHIPKNLPLFAAAGHCTVQYVLWIKHQCHSSFPTVTPLTILVVPCEIKHPRCCLLHPSTNFRAAAPVCKLKHLQRGGYSTNGTTNHCCKFQVS